MLSNNKRLRYFVSFMLEAATFIIFYNVAWWVAGQMKDLKHDLSWGITVKYSFYLFIIICLVGLIVRQVTPKISTKGNSGLALGSVLLFTALVVSNKGYHPYRTLLLILTGIVGYSIGWLYTRARKENK